MKVQKLGEDQQFVFNKVLDFKKGGEPFFLYVDGPAGSGKTHLINSICSLEDEGFAISLSALTGNAAILLGEKATTMHRAFDFPANPYPFAASKNNGFPAQFADLIIIDEVSMMSAGHFAAILDRLKLRLNNTDNTETTPSIIFVGDHAQLPPVIKDVELQQLFRQELNGLKWRTTVLRDCLKDIYKNNIGTKELTQIYRQKNDFVSIELLQNIRQCKELASTVNRINGLCYKPNNICNKAVYLYGTNALVDDHNLRELDNLLGATYISERILQGTYTKEDFSDIPEKIILKVGCKVMITANIYKKEKFDPRSGQSFEDFKRQQAQQEPELLAVNGDMGEVISFYLEDKGRPVQVLLDRTGELVSISVIKREIQELSNIEGGTKKEYVVKAYCHQVPLKLAYALNNTQVARNDAKQGSPDTRELFF